MNKKGFTVEEMREAVEELQKNSIPSNALAARCDRNGMLIGGLINKWEYQPRIMKTEDIEYEA